MSFFKSIFKSFGAMLGLGGSDKLAKQQQEQLDQLKAQQTIQSANEEKQVAQFDSQDTDTYANDITRKKKSSVGASSAAVQLGLSGS